MGIIQTIDIPGDLILVRRYRERLNMTEGASLQSENNVKLKLTSRSFDDN